MKVCALVTSVRKTAGEYVLSTISESGRCIITSKKRFAPGTIIEAVGEEILGDGVKEISASSARSLEGKEASVAGTKIRELVDASCQPGKERLLDDPIMRKMDAAFDAAAYAIKEAIFLNRPIIMRFHRDTDGVCSALALYSVIQPRTNFRAFVNHYPNYRMIEAREDVLLPHTLDADYLPPLLLILDFGANPESMESLRFVKEDGFKIVIIDHHPIYEEVTSVADVVVSPHLVGGTSHYITGLLASEVSQRVARTNIRDLHFIAAAGDRSTLLPLREEHKKASAAIDFLVYTSKFHPTIENFNRLLSDREEMALAYTQATEKLESMTKALLKKVKTRTIGDAKVFFVDTDGLFTEGEYPGRGEMASAVHDALAKDLKTPGITVGFGKRSANMRLNVAALKRGFGADYIIEGIKEAMPNALEAGGGHHVAAGMRIKKGYIKVVLDQLLKEIEKIK